MVVKNEITRVRLAIDGIDSVINDFNTAINIDPNTKELIIRNLYQAQTKLMAAECLMNDIPTKLKFVNKR